MRTHPVLVYDGDCGFCTASARTVRRLLDPRCEFTAWQAADLDSLGVSQERAEYEALWVTPRGEVYGGAQAVARLLLRAGGAWAVPGALLTLPPLRWIAHAVYRVVAANRRRLPGWTPTCAALPPRPSPPAPPEVRSPS
ncbi:thiol-disulfide oxidoreductase DCC family protein [Streptomyces sp. cmx-4-9]|uniref:thiol-disulfide oxidoreductase DCC family protein n=1 Tax=Streptomyces sp. cmx-4-9 TaxID=2790941 RepID=UPI0039816F5A